MASLQHLTHLLPALDRLIEATSPRSKEQASRPLERRVRRALVAMWAEQQRLLLDHLEAQAWRFTTQLVEAGPIPDNTFDRIWNTVTTLTAGPLVALLDQIAPLAMQRGHRAGASDVGIGISFDLDHPNAVAYLRDYGARLVTGINDTTRDQLRTLLTQAADKGWSYQRTAAQIRARFVGFGGPSPLQHIRDRAELVAVTEVGNAYEHGQRLVIDQLAADNIATEKSWMEAGDERVCPVCEAGADAGWIASTEQFPNGLDGPLGHPGCRCALALQVAAESRVAVDA